MGGRVLFVDDDRSVLKALERLFFDSDCEIFTAESGEQGLEILAGQQVDLVVSDMRMPEMDGHKFLIKVKSLYPNTARLMLSGYANDKEILNSIIDGSCSMYLFKPWESEDFKSRIEKILDARQLYRSQNLQQIVNGLENLSLITGIYNKVCALIEKEAEVNAIAKVIETDPAVTAAVLRIVNSAFFNIKTGSVAQAITFLGLPTVKAIVLSCTLQQNITLKAAPPFSLDVLARHANLTNLHMARIYTELLQKPRPEALATAGLLHNIGLIMGLHYFPENYNKLAKNLLKQTNDNALLMEKEAIGLNHAELGGYLLDWWGLPYPMVECALFHHEPLHGAIIDKEGVAVTHLANYYAWLDILRRPVSQLDMRVFELLNIEEESCKRLVKA